jgi:hypothetical protein
VWEEARSAANWWLLARLPAVRAVRLRLGQPASVGSMQRLARHRVCRERLEPLDRQAPALARPVERRIVAARGGLGLVFPRSARRSSRPQVLVARRRVRCRSVAPPWAASVRVREAAPVLVTPMFHSVPGRGWWCRAALVSWSRRAGEQAAFHSAGAAEHAMAAALALVPGPAAAALLAEGRMPARMLPIATAAATAAAVAVAVAPAAAVLPAAGPMPACMLLVATAAALAAVVAADPAVAAVLLAAATPATAGPAI